MNPCTTHKLPVQNMNVILHFTIRLCILINERLLMSSYAAIAAGSVRSTFEGW
jgi:hypothetical protein